jgi:multimeric flavodoxin WrbA
MIITTLSGSARKKGNTATILGLVEKELVSMGHDVQQIPLINKVIKGCLGCCACHKYPDEIACVRKDDAIEILEQMISSDVILFASPIYFWGFTAQLKALIDRSYSLVTGYQTPEHNSLVRGKRVGLLVTGGDSYENNAESMFTAHERFVDFLYAEKSGELYIGGCDVSAEVPEEVNSKALALAQKLVS